MDKAELENLVASLNVDLESAMSSLRERDAALEQSTADKAELENSVTSLNVELESAMSSLRERDAALEQSTADKADLEISVASLSHDLESAMSSLRERDAALEQSTADKAELENSVASLSHDLESAMSSLRERDAAKEPTLLDSAEHESTAISQTNDLRSALLTIQEKDTEIEFIKLEKADLEFTVHSLKIEIERFESARHESLKIEESLQSRIDECHHIEEQRQQAMSALGAVKEELCSLQVAYDNYRVSTEGQLLSLKAELESANTTIVENGTSCIEHQREIVDLRCELDKITLHFNEASQKLIAAEESKSLSEVKLTDLKETLRQAEQGGMKNLSLEGKICELANSCTMHENRCIVLEENLRESKMEIQALQNALAGNDAQVLNLRKENTQLQDLRRTEQNARSEELSKLNAAFEEVSQRAKTAEHFMKTTLSNENANRDSDEVLRKRLSQQAFALEIAKNEKTQMESRISSLEKEMKLSMQQAVCMEENLQKELLSARTQIDSLKSQLDAASGLRESCKRLELKLQDALSEKDSAISAMNEMLVKDSALEDEIIAMKQELRSFKGLGDENPFEKLRLELDLARKHESELISKLSSAENDIAESRRRHKKLKDEISILSQDCLNANIMVDSANVEIESLKKHLEIAQAEAVDSGKLEILHQSLREAEKRCSVQSEEMANLRSALVVAEGVSKEHESRCHSLESRLTEAFSIVSSKEKELMRLELLLKEAEQKSADSQLLEEMNIIMEAKLQAESKHQALELELKNVRAQLSEYDRISAKEQANIMQAAEMEMENLRRKLVSAEEKSQRKIEAMASELQDKADIEATLLEKEEILRKWEDELYTLRGVEQQLKAYKDESEKLIATKDQRIIHLEACKLTQDQVEKIKVVKEERKKYLDESRILKKQLVELKKLYDDLKRSTATARSTPQATNEIQDLHDSVAETNRQLEESRVLTKSLRDKLRECSRQLQDYENERIAVADILSRHGVDVKGLLDSNISNDEGSVIEQDLADCVNKLAQRFTALQKQLKSSFRTKDAEEEMERLSIELEDTKLQRSALEKRISTLQLVL